MSAKVPRTYGSNDSPDTTPAWRGTVAIERMERAVRNRVRAQSAWLLFAPVLGLLVALVHVLSQPAMYESTGRVRQVPSSLQAPPPQGLPPGYTYYGVNAIRPHERADELQILTSRTFLNGVAQSLSPELQKRLLEDDPKDYTPEQLLTTLTTELADGLTIDGNSRDELFVISFDHPDRELTADVVNQIIASAALVGLHLGLERNRRAASLFAGQILGLKQQIRDARERENAVERGNDLMRRQAQRKAGVKFDFEAGLNDADPELGPLMKAATEARLQKALAQGELHLLQTLGKDAEPSVESLPELHALRTDLYRAQAEYAALGAMLGPRQPEMEGRAAQIAHYQQQLNTVAADRLMMARTNAAEATLNAQALTAESIRHQQGLAQIQKEQVRDAMLEIDLVLNLSVYEAIQAKLQQSKINAGLGATDLQVIDRAEAPDKPLPRAYLLPLCFGVAIGLIVGMLMSVYLAQRGLRRWTLAQIEHHAELPVLTVLSERADRMAGTAAAGVPSEFEDGLLLLDNELQLMPQRDRGGRPAEVVLFTSAAPSEGKTAAISSYAALSARRGRRVLLVDADLHRPAVHKFFGLSGRKGLTTILNGRGNFADMVQKVGALDVLVAGPVPPSPSDLLAVKGFTDLLTEAGKQYDLILIDTPPVLALMDAVTLSLAVDLVLLVTRYGVVTLAQVARAINLLGRAGAPLGGLLINGAPAK